MLLQSIWMWLRHQGQNFESKGLLVPNLKISTTSLLKRKQSEMPPKMLPSDLFLKLRVPLDSPYPAINFGVFGPRGSKFWAQGPFDNKQHLTLLSWLGPQRTKPFCHLLKKSALFLQNLAIWVSIGGWRNLIHGRGTIVAIMAWWGEKKEWGWFWPNWTGPVCWYQHFWPVHKRDFFNLLLSDVLSTETF